MFEFRVRIKRSFALYVLLSMVLAIGTTARASEPTDSIILTADSVPNRKGNLLHRIIQYFDDSNKSKNPEGFDFSIIGGPHYSSDTKFGLGLVAAGLYSTDPSDSLLQTSQVSLYGDISSVGFYLIGIRGNHIMPHDRYRLNYNLQFYSFLSKFWGIGYENAINDANETKYKRFQAKVEADFAIRLADNLYAGPAAAFEYVSLRDSKNVDMALWDYESPTTTNVGIGATVCYDSRDNISNAWHGAYVRLDQRCFPRAIGNKYAFSLTELTANWYCPVWKGGVIATQYHARLTYGNTPWGLLSTLGGSDSMRGYYEGRFRDKGAMDATIELRQHVWHRNGMVAWIGAGTIFPKISAMRWKHILPNYGIGYRWEFKNRVNVRLDLGFGRHTSGFVFNINEAF